MKIKTEEIRGFTLIELLVVIAIISLLSSVVLASLNSARGKGADGSIKSNLSQVRTQSELYYDNNGGNYGTVAAATSAAQCVAGTATTLVFKDPIITRQLTSALAQSNPTNVLGTSGAVCSTNANPATAWAVSIPLKSTPTNSWCVDSTGKSKSITGNISSSVCP